ncbi:unnamed protein product [Closterium sp. Naga37s-1]|nr:unnamed protein product [Closterium sp. Naga37s-1]
MAARRIPATVAALAAATAAGFASAIAVLVLSRPLHSLPAILHAFLLRILLRITRTFLPNCAGSRLLHSTRSVLSSSVEAPPVSSLHSSSNQNAPAASQCRLNMDGCDSLLGVAPSDIDGFKAAPAADATCCATGCATPTTGRATPATGIEPTSHNRDGPRAAIGRREIHEASQKCRDERDGREGLVAAIGNTPLIRIASLSAATGCEIYGKAEFVNPGGSVKDRVALRIVQEALESGQLKPGGLITEGSAGSTGVALALVAAAFGCRCFVAMPDDAAVEKAEAMRALGAEVLPDRSSGSSVGRFDSVANPAVPCGTTSSSSGGGSGSGFFADQFENLANYRAHYCGTGPEIWRQAGGAVDAFVAAAGTGGTIAGISCYLKVSGCERLRVVVSDCELGGEWLNLANYRAHYCGTGPEIWRQTGGAVGAFVAVAGTGTGATIAGVGCRASSR